jgi:hypothetical protein
MSGAKGLIVEVHCNEPPSRCNLLWDKDILVVGPGIPELFDEETTNIITKVTSRRQVYVLEKGHSNTALLRPKYHKGWTMFGNSFAYTSDSRLVEAVRVLINTPNFRGAIPIHDWTEDVEFMKG